MDKENQIKPYNDAMLPYDPVLLVLDAAKRWLLVVLSAMLCGMAAYVMANSFYVPQYQSEATLVLTTRDSSSSVYDNLDSTTRLAGIFTEVLNSSVMRSNILEELQMDSFQGTINASAIEETNLLTLRVTAGDPGSAFRMAKALVENHDIVTYQVMGDIVLEVLEPPMVPTAPSNTVDTRESMLKAAIIGAVLAFVFLMVQSYFRDTVRSRREAEEKLECWCLGEIRHERKHRTFREWIGRSKKSILISDPRTGFSYVTTLNKLRRRVEQHMPRGNVLMVTSVGENEGKSTVAVNLALAMAKKYKRVLLIDCDLYKPACDKILEHAPHAHHTAEVIRGKISLAEAVVRDKRGGMDVLSARRTGGKEAEALFTSAGLEAMVRQARERYDFVVIDLPPMAASPDSETMTEYADGSLLVVRQNAINAVDLNRAIGDLQRGKAKLLGCVLNNVFEMGGASGKGLGMGYRNYGRYGNYDRRPGK